MKKAIFLTFIILFSFSCEEDKEKTENLGKQAAIEFCDCYESNSKEHCLEELKANYSSSDYMNNDFIEAFNQQSECGITLEKIQTYTKSYSPDINIMD